MAKIDDEIEIRTVYRAVPKVGVCSCRECVGLDNDTLCDTLSGKKAGACRDIIWVKMRSEVYSG